MFDLSGKAAIVTGGNGGIGLGMALGLAKAGAHVAIFGRNQEKNESAVRELKNADDQASVYSVDVTDAVAVETAVGEVAERYERLDILINNAGMNAGGPAEDLSEEDWNAVLSANVTSAFLCSKTCYPEFKKMGGGKILNCGSMSSLFGVSFAPAYSASKGAIVQLTKSLAVGWAVDNIQVNAFLPGWINTDLTAGAKEMLPDLHDNVLRRTPAGRWGEPKDLEGIAVFLASEASDFITGAVIPVDGGYAVSG